MRLGLEFAHLVELVSHLGVLLVTTPVPAAPLVPAATVAAAISAAPSAVVPALSPVDLDRFLFAAVIVIGSRRERQRRPNGGEDGGQRQSENLHGRLLLKDP